MPKATKETVTRWVCDACGAIWFNAPAGHCPSCSGAGRERECTVDHAGVVKPVDE